MIRTAIALLCLTGYLLADEYTVTEKPFKKVTTLKGTFLPSESTPISISPETWKDFAITSFVEQGAAVKKGDVLIGIDTTKIDEKIAQAEQEREIELLQLAKAKHELEQLEISTPIKLEKLARAENEASDNLKWFTEIGMPNEIKVTMFQVTQHEQLLAYQMEELKQLEKMYSEDNKTEETEEIILIRTRNTVEQYKFQLESVKISTARSLNTRIPRKLEGFQRAAEDSRIAHTAAKEGLNKTLEIKRLKLTQAEKTDTKKANKLTQLKADRAMMQIIAPADGIIYYGSIENGYWKPGAATKAFKIGNNLPVNRTLLTFIPAQAPLTLTAFANEEQLRSLTKGATGHASTQINPYTHFPVSIDNLRGYPETDNTYRVNISLDTQQNEKIVPGMTSQVHIITNKLDSAIVVPKDYLTTQEDGSHSIQLKLADGKTDPRSVKISAMNKDEAVIIQGLELDQVIVK